MGEPPPLGHLVAALSAHTDVASMTQVLTATLADLLPADVVEVDYERSVADRLRGRPGRPARLTVRTGGETDLVLHSGPDGRTESSIVHTVRGVVLSRTPVPIEQWIQRLAAELAGLAARDDGARRALDRLLLG